MTESRFPKSFWAGFAAWMIVAWSLISVLALIFDLYEREGWAQFLTGTAILIIAWTTANVVEKAVVRKVRGY